MLGTKEYLQQASKAELVEFIRCEKAEATPEIVQEAVCLCRENYGTQVFMRALIEFTNYCKNDCYYCGIRKSNHKLRRYRLVQDEILLCAKNAYSLGFRSFVLQGGEDAYYDDVRMCKIVSALRQAYSDCAITLSIGERSRESYRRLFEAGANRYLLRHETATETHYKILHPETMQLQKRKDCLYNLKDIGFQVGAGFMVGSPGQTDEELAEDLLFLKALQPQMVGIGPFIPHKDSPFAAKWAGKLEDTLLMLTMTRLMLPKALIPATTALASLDLAGRGKGLLAGANVLMPNISPQENRKDYALYDNKLYSGKESAQSLKDLMQELSALGLQGTGARGDAL